MTRQYDLLVLDLDGTLLQPDGAVPAENIEALEAARHDGLEILLATGRALIESIHIAEAVDHRGEMVTAGGAMRQCADSGRTVDRHTMEAGLVAELTAALIEHEHRALLLKDPAVCGYDYLAVGPAEFDPASSWWFRTMPITVREVDSLADDPHPADTVRVGAVGSKTSLAPLARDLIDTLGDRVFLQHWGAVTETTSTGASTHLLEAFEPAANKWTMVSRYAAERGIDRRRIAAIGDGLNDVELVREAALGIAMGNADDRVRAVADQTTTSSDTAGVARAVDAILEGRW